MIRYYKTDEYRVADFQGVPFPTERADYIVTAKRKVRGYVKRVIENRTEYFHVGRNEIRSRDVIKTGFRAVGLNGKVGFFRDSRQEAAEDLVSNHRFRLLQDCPDCSVSIYEYERCPGWLLESCLKPATTLVKR